MGASTALKKILIDKGLTQTALAEQMDKPRQTVFNTFHKDQMLVSTAMEYGKALGCTLCYIDDETGERYKIT